MFQNDQKHFKNLVANATRLLSVSHHFEKSSIKGTLMQI